MSVLHKRLSVNIIESLRSSANHGFMNEAASHRVLVLGATGKTGSRVASKLSERGVSVRTAARRGAEVHFDWDDPATFEPAIHGASGAYVCLPRDAHRLRRRGLPLPG